MIGGAHFGDTMNIVTDISSEISEDVGARADNVFEFLGKGIGNAAEDANNTTCSGSCQFKWTF